MMSLNGSLVFLALAMFKAPETYAEASCPTALKWADASFVQRTTTKNGRVFKADARRFVNAFKAHLCVDGVCSAMIEVNSKDLTRPIQLTFGDGKPNPAEFSEIPIVLEPPMADGTWHGMHSPCSVPDGVTVEFDENDIPVFEKGHAHAIPGFKGVLRRSGLRISYSMDVEDGESWQGEANYSRELNIVDLRTDVQGWHVFRANSYVETLPVGKPMFLLSVIEKMTLGDPTN